MLAEPGAHMTAIDNPKLPGSLRLFSALVIVVLIVGAGLFVAPDAVKPRWPWTLAPFNARFLGSFYIAEMVAMGALLYWNRWSPARVVLVMALVFTVVVSVTSFLHLDVFNFGRKSTWIWFAVYLGSAAVSGLALLSWRDAAPVSPAISGSSWATRCRIEAALFGLYGLGLLFLPDQSGSFWPWKIDAFHAQTYSAIFLTGAAGLWVLSGGAPREELITVGAAQVALGLLPIVGLVITDAAVKRVDWSATGGWVWIAIFAAIAIAGVVKLRSGLAARAG